MSVLDYFDEVRQSLAENNVEEVAKNLERLGYHSDGTIDSHNFESKVNLCAFLSLVASIADCVDISEEIAHVIIDRASCVVEPDLMLSLIIHHKSIKKPSYNAIPVNVRKALRDDGYDEKIGKQIANLSDKATEALMFYIILELNRWDSKYTASLMRAAYRTMGGGMFFAFMGLSVVEPQIDVPSIGIIVGGKGEIAPPEGNVIAVRVEVVNRGRDGRKSKGTTDVPEEGDSLKA